MILKMKYDRTSFSRISRLACLILVAYIIVSIIPMNIFADEVNPKHYSIEKGYSFETKTIVTSSWEGYANIDLKIKNTGDQKIENWHLTFETPYTIENIWNASILEIESGRTYTIRNNYYNQDIDVNSEVTIGMTLSIGESEFENLSNWYLLNTKRVEVDSNYFFISYQEYSRWDGGYNGALILSSQEYVEDWSLTFDSEYEISSISNATMDINEEGLYQITNDGNTQNLNSEMIFLSVQGKTTENEFELRDVTMFSVGLAYSLTEDSDNNGIADYQDYINIHEGLISVTQTPTAEPTITPVPIVTGEPTENPTDIPTITSEPTITVTQDYERYLDSDNDKLLNYEEDIYGTDKNDADSDDDLLDDFTEIRIGYDPNNSDSDKNGISDGDEDFDKDGVTNAIEVEVGSCPYLPDADFDNINDYDELYVYGTDPNKEDSNDDGILDGDALKLGLNPASLDSDFDGIPDRDERTYQKIELQIADDSELKGVVSVEVKGEFTNLITSTTTIEDMYGKDVYSSEIEAIVGGLVNIETTSSFDNCTIIFHYDETEIGVDEDDLCILWYDEANGEYIMLDESQVLDKDKNTVSYETTHFSEYMLISKTKWIETWVNSIQTLSNNRAKYLAEGDSSVKYLIAMNYADVDTNKFREQTEDAFNAVIDCMEDDDIMFLTYFNTYGHGFKLANKSEYSQKVNEMKYKKDIYPDLEESWWGPDFTNLLYVSTVYGNMYSQPSDKVVIIMITDAYDIDLDEAKEEFIDYFGREPLCDGFIIISLGDTNYLESDDYPCQMINKEISTDKMQLQMNFPIKMAALLSELDVEFDIIKDTDGDTLSDFDEITGHLLSNGTIVKTDPNTKYTDKDSLTDDEELGTRRSFKQSSIFKACSSRGLLGTDIDELWFFECLSDPTDHDKDKDGFDDDVDARKMTENPDAVYIYTLPEFKWYAEIIKCRYQEVYTGKIFLETFHTYDMFVYYWNGIGLSREYFASEYQALLESQRKPYGERYYYNPLATVIISHGTSGSLQVSSNVLEKAYVDEVFQAGLYTEGDVGNVPIYDFNELKIVRIKNLFLLCCECASKTYYGAKINTNVAQFFMNKFDIETLYAYDGKGDFFKDESSQYGFYLYTLTDLPLRDDTGNYVGEKGILKFCYPGDDGTDVYDNDVLCSHSSQDDFIPNIYDPIFDFVLSN